MSSKTGHAFLDTFFSEGRRYGVTTHLELVPTDRYRALVGSDFHGVEIGKDVQFPFAFVRKMGATFENGKKAEYRAVLPLTGKKKFIQNRLHYETTDGNYISDRVASELRPAKNMPGWAKKGEKWISISINKQTLVLYEGENPVYATLVSTGEAGLESHETTTATKRGIFRVHTKHVTSTMASDELGEEFELRDVPYVQYFAQGGYALHGAYWHDRFGTPKSHGCINLAPEDARRIFHWTDPQVPTGWHTAMLPLKGTVIFIHP
jgi:lipoprotein-anchoring transpeptidase ErfK/SrfK